MAKKLIPSSQFVFQKDANQILLDGNIHKNRILLITDVDSNTTIYQFNNPAKGGNTFYDEAEEITVLNLTYNTANDENISQASADLQIFIDQKDTEFSPTKSLLDAVGKLRISSPENLIDTDFEYGLQSSKWETIQSVSNVPTVYSYSGDVPIEGVTSVTALQGSKQIKVVTNVPHGLALGDPLSVQGVTQYQAEGFFIITGVPDANTFFFDLDVEATGTGDISGSYTNIIPAKFYQGSALIMDDAEGVRTDGANPSTLLATTDQTHGFANGTKVYLRNTVGPKKLSIPDPTATAADGRPVVDTDSFFATQLAVDAQASTGRGGARDKTVITYDWEPVYSLYLSADSIDTGTNQITWSGHSMKNRFCLLFNTPHHGDTDGGLIDGSVYFVNVIDDDTIQLSTSYADPTTNIVDLTTLNNTNGPCRLGLVYKIEANDGNYRYTAFHEETVSRGVDYWNGRDTIRSVTLAGESTYDNYTSYFYSTNDTSISDGGGDMFDGGNRIQYGRNGSYTSDIFHSRTYLQSGPGGLNYWALGNSAPMLSFAVTPPGDNTRWYVRSSGNLGADGRGSRERTFIYNNTDMGNGFRATAYKVNTYNAGDPAVCHVFWALSNIGAWGGAGPSSPSGSASSSTDSDNNNFSVIGSNLVMGHYLLSITNGRYINNTTAGGPLREIIQDLVDNNFASSSGSGLAITDTLREHSGSDLETLQFGLGQQPGTALIAFQGRDPSVTPSYQTGEGYSYLSNQRFNGRYGTIRPQYPTTSVTAGNVGTSPDGTFGYFQTDFNDTNLEEFGRDSEIFYVMARRLDSDSNTIYVPNHGIKEGDTVVVNVNATEYAAGQRFHYSDANGGSVEIPAQQFTTTASVLNQDVFRLLAEVDPNTDDITRFPDNFTAEVRTENSLYNTIYVPNHRITSLTNATYISLGEWQTGPFYVYGTDTQGLGYYYPLYTNETAAQEADANGAAHTHTFNEYPGTTFYMPTDNMNHAESTAPTDGTPSWLGANNKYSVGLADTGTDFIFNGRGLDTDTVEPTLTLYRGSTYYFNVQTLTEPFYIKTALTAGTADQQTTGVSNNGSTNSIITFAVPLDAPNTLYYTSDDTAYSGTFTIADATTSIGGLTTNTGYTLERVNDSRLTVTDQITEESTAITATLGAANNNTLTYEVDVETPLGITDPTTTVITRIEYRGDFGSERRNEEYVTLSFGDGDTFVVGQNGGADTDQWLTETSFSSKDVSSLLTTLANGNVGFEVTVDPTSDVNVPFYLSSGNYYELRFTVTGQAGTLLLTAGGTGAQEFNVPSVVGSYDGIYTVSEVNNPKTMTMDASFEIPKRLYEFDATHVDTLSYSIDFGEDHNLKTGEKISYGSKGNPSILPADQDPDELFVIAVDGQKIRLASSKISALANSGIALTAPTGIHQLESTNIIKNVPGTGFVSGVTGSLEIVGTGTSFLSSFKTFDKIYLIVDGFEQGFTVDKITTNQNMTVFEPMPADFTNADYFYTTELNLRPDGFSLHLPFDGGVNITAGTSPGSKIVRQSRKYFRYQSGKAIQNSFAINFNPPRVVREVIKAQGTTATVLTQEVHNLAVGDPIVIQDAIVSVGPNTYNGNFRVATAPDPFTFTYEMAAEPQQVKAEGYPKYLRKTWNDSFVRAGMFDDQNGFFYEYDGQDLYAVRRSSTLQLSGTVSVTRSGQLVTGAGTSFTTQLNVGDKIVLRGQSYAVVQVSSDNRLVIQPAYRGVSASNVKLTKTVDVRTPQNQWNLDKCDGTGPTGFVLDTTKLQMAYADYSWYGAGKIRYGFKDQDGEIQYVHEYKHNNRLSESYFRSGNLPGRYEIENGPQASTAPTLFHFGTSIIMDGTFDDDKAYLFTGNSSPFAYTNGTSNNITLSAASTFEVITLDGKRVFVYALTVPESDLANVTTGLQLSDSSDTLPEGTFVTQIQVNGNDSKIYTSYPAITTQPAGAAYPDIPNGAAVTLGETTAIDLTQPLPLVSIRLAPSVDSSLTGAVGQREIINRMQMALKEAGVTTNLDVEVFLILNALPNSLNFAKVQPPSLSEIIKHKPGDTLIGGTTVYSLKASAGSIAIALNDLIELGNSILGGDGIFPAGPDFLTLAVQPQETSSVNGANPFFVSGKLSWSESQA